MDDYAAGGASSVTAKCLSGTPRGPGLDRSRVIAQDALLLVTDQVGLQHPLRALHARHDERHGCGVALVRNVLGSGPFRPDRIEDR